MRGYGGGGLTVAQRAEKAMLALGPSHRFRADVYTLDGSNNLATLPNMVGAGALVAGGTAIPEPAADALLGGRKSVTLGGTSYLLSSLAAAAWKNLHDGTGGEWWLVFVPKQASGVQSYLATVDNSVTRGIVVYSSTAQLVQQIVSGSTGATSGPTTSITVDSPTYVSGGFKSGRN